MSLVLPNNPQAQEIHHQQRMMQRGQQLLEQLTLAIYSALAGHASVYEIEDPVKRTEELEQCADRAHEAAAVMCSRFGFKFTRVAPDSAL